MSSASYHFSPRINGIRVRVNVQCESPLSVQIVNALVVIRLLMVRYQP